MQEPKGYPTGCGWMGWLPRARTWRLFATEQEYVEYFYDDE